MKMALSAFDAADSNRLVILNNITAEGRLNEM